MSKKYYIADTHLGHEKCLEFDPRPFLSIEEHDQAIIDKWNKIVKDEDHIYVIGDFAYRNKQPVISYVSRLKGHIHLVRGNHDKRREQYESCFESVDDILVIEDETYRPHCQVTLCHYWTPFGPGQRHGGFMLHGHTHKGKESALEEEMKEQLRRKGIRCEAYNVGCMWQDYCPQTLEQIIKRQNRSDII